MKLLKKLLFKNSRIFALLLVWINSSFIQPTIRAQSFHKNVISFEISPVQYFYDGISPFNTKSGMSENIIIPFIFKGRLRGSVGIKYGYIFNDNYKIRTGWSMFQATGYSASGYLPNEWNLVTRYHRRLNIEFRRHWLIQERITAFVGIGTAVRFDRSVLRYSNATCVGCAQVDQHYSTDLSLDAFFGVRTRLTDKIFTSVSIDNMWIIYRGGESSIQNLETKGD